jgi:hypothetical protein
MLHYMTEHWPICELDDMGVPDYLEWTKDTPIHRTLATGRVTYL